MPETQDATKELSRQMRVLLDEPHIRPPLHISCRCYMVPVTLSYKELGLNIPEMEASLKPFTERAGNRAIIKSGQLEDKGFEAFIKSRDEQYQINFFGINRYKFWKAGDIGIKDLADKNGNLRLLRKNKEGDYVGIM